MKLMMPPAARVTEPSGSTSKTALRDTAFMIMVLAAMVAGLWGRGDYESVPAPGLLLLALVSYLPLLVRDRWPVGVVVAVVVVEVLHLVLLPVLGPSVDPSTMVAAFQPVPVATMAAMYSLALRRDKILTWRFGLTSGAILFLVAFFLYPSNLLATTLVMGNLVVIATAVGASVRNRRTSQFRREQEHQEHVRQQVFAERMRIARELHDVLAHNLTLVNAQAGVAKYLLATDPAAADTALSNIAKHTRKAIDDLRSTVGLLREEDSTSTSAPAPEGGAERSASRAGKSDGGASGHSTSVYDQVNPADLTPTHTLEHLPEMLDSFRSAGNFLHYTEHGDPAELPPLNDLGAYRIIQESLTNAAKHASRAPIRVELRWTTNSLEIAVSNDSPPLGAAGYPRPHRPTGTGHGLIGMRERALTAGGTFNAAPLPEGGFRVVARIPTGHHDLEGAS